MSEIYGEIPGSEGFGDYYETVLHTQEQLIDRNRESNDLMGELVAASRNLRPLRTIKFALHIGRDVTKEDVMLEEAYQMDRQFDAERSHHTPAE